MKHTPITAEIIRIQTIIDEGGLLEHHYEALYNHISILIPMLPAEKEALINAWSKGREIGSIYESEQYFSQTYTQDYKTK